MLDNEERSIT